MTRAFGDRIFEDENGDIGEHLRNHIHLTNCIHVKNHIHKHSPMLSDRALIRDLIVLQRSRSLRDPSASPPSWHSHPVIDMLGNRNAIEEGRRSLGIERSSRVFGTGGSAALGNFATSKVVPGEVNVFSNGIVASSERINKTGVRDGRRRVGRDDSSRRSSGTNVLGVKDEPLQNEDGNAFVLKAVSGNSESKVSNTKAGNLTLSQQLNDLPMDSDDVASSNVRPWRRHSGLGKMGDEAEVSIHGHSKVLNRAKWRKHRTARRTRASTTSKVRDQTEFSMALNSFAHGSTHQKQQTQENEDEYKEQNVTRAPKNGCGIPWNWSRIHHSGKTFLDMAGRSLSCGLSDSRLRRGTAGSHGRGVHAMPVASDYSSCSTKSDAQVLPLLVDASISPGTAENGTWVNDYSGELGIYVENLLRNNIDSDLASEDRSSGCRKLGSSHNVGHQNLTHKYMPKTFKDLVGQNLVAQALSNAVMKRKVGVLYVFYGPHGTGKTSCARIFARSLNCRSPGHPKPCGYCNSCVAHDLGKSRSTREVGPVSSIDFKGIMDVIDKSILSEVTSQYRVVIFDDCDTLPPDCWNAILKIIDKAPRRVVFILVCSSLDVLPHMIISRCQKFFFPKLRDADIVYTLQWISSKEDVEIDDDALKLIASRSDGSLRDAEMTLEQLSLLGQKISVPLVQELVGLISDEKLVDLLDLALSADTVNTVKSLRVIMETGVEPLALMSQLATIVTDILAGSYDFTKERNKRKFFRQQPLAKEDMEKLRQALKTLSEAEKQLRMSNDKLTWLTAALLQLAPDQQYMVPISAAETVYHSPEAPNDAAGRYLDRRGGELVVVPNGSAGFSRNGTSMDRKRHAGTSGLLEGQNLKLHSDIIPITAKQSLQRNGVEDIWLEVLEKIQNSSLKEFLSKEGKLISVSFGAAPTVYLMFSSPMTKSKAEKFRGHILQAFEAALNSPVTIEIRCGTQKDARSVFHLPVISPASRNDSMSAVIEPFTSGSRMQRVGYDSGRRNCNIQDNGAGSQAEFLHLKSLEVGRNEIVEVLASPRKAEDVEHANNTAASTWDVNMGSTSGRRTVGEESQTQSVVRSRMSLAHVIQHSEGSIMKNGRSKHKAVSIAEKLEQENLRLEPRSRSLLCWKASRMTRQKLSRLKIGKRRPCSLLKVVSCGRCLNSKSPR